MGAPTLNVGSFHGGLNVNSVPDRAEIGIDLRTLPGMRHDQLLEQLASYLGADVAHPSAIRADELPRNAGNARCTNKLAGKLGCSMADVYERVPALGKSFS